MDYGNELRKRKPYFLYTGNRPRREPTSPVPIVDLGTGTYQWTKKTEELNQFLNHAARRRLCRKSIAGSTHYRYCCRNGRKGAACHSFAGCDYLSNRLLRRFTSSEKLPLTDGAPIKRRLWSARTTDSLRGQES